VSDLITWERGWIGRSLAVTRPPDRRLWLITAVAALAADVAGRGVIGVGGAVLTVVAAAGILASDRVPNAWAWPLVLAVPAFGCWLAVRTAPWLLALDVLAVIGLVVLAASFARDGDPSDVTVPALAERAAVTGLHLAAAPAFLLRRNRDESSPSRRATTLPIRMVTGLLLAAPVVLLLALLLGSADPVFASFFDIHVDTGGIVRHLFLLVSGTWVMAGLLRTASAAPPSPLPTTSARLGFVESSTILGSLVVLYGAFAVAQLVAAAGGARHVLETEGLTYAEYARSGFFQLIAAAALTLGVLVGLRAVAERATEAQQRRFTVLAEAAVVLTLVIVVVALRRLQLYERAYGLTELRLFSSVFAWWVGVVFVLLGLSLAGLHGRRAWLLPAALLAGLVTLFVLNAANPEAIVVKRNLDHYERTGKIDVRYLTGLSPDAVPAAVEGLDRVDPSTRAALLAWICERPSGSNRGFAWTLGHHRAAVARASVCGPATS
jgi:hypothetical protein